MAAANKVNEKDQKEKDQKDRALKLFIGLLLVFGISLYFLLAVQYLYWPWDKLGKELAESAAIASQTATVTPVGQVEGTPTPTGQVEATPYTGLTSKEKIDSFSPLKWVLASLIGAAIYLIGQIATNYPKISDKPETDNQNDFIKSTYWYISTLLRAPILTVVIMWLLINLKINLGEDNKINEIGIAVDFSKFSDLVKIGIAFILGFYGRVARKQLDIIAKYLFTRAWALAEMGFEVASSSPDIILLKDTYTFKTDPVMDVVWTANIGTMEADTGTYKATEDVNDDGKSVVIRAYLRGEPSSTQFKEVKLKLFKITGNKTTTSNGAVPLKLETKFDKIGDKTFDLAQADWTCTGGTLSATKGKEVTVTATAADVIKVTATINKYEADFEIKIDKK